MIPVIVLAFVATSAAAETRFAFTTSRASEVVATVELSSPDADWAIRGLEASVALLKLNGKPHQHILTYAGPKRYGYRVSLGYVEPGKHEITVERLSGTNLQAHGFQIEEIATTSPEYAVYANAPVLFARLNTIGRFSDIPLVLYCERLPGNTLQYTVIFSNEDGGTSTRDLMARWGRSTDIEYVYRRSLDSKHAIVQGPDHKDLEFNGEHEREHPLLMPVTDNNMIAAAKDSPLKFRLAPVLADLTNASRETIMDRFPVTYSVMAKELEREGQLRPFGVVTGEKISDQRNYLMVDYHATFTRGALSVAAQTRDGKLYSSDLGRSDLAIARDGHVRTTVELPPGTTRDNIAALVFECRVPPAAKKQAGSCDVHGISKAFKLQDDYTPGPSIFSLSQPVSIPTGQAVSFAP
jgi:hypothetical protein